MTRNPLSIGSHLSRALRRERIVRAALVLWLIAALPYFFPILGPEQLSIHSEFWIDLLLLPIVLVAVLSGIRTLGSATERRFWYLIAAALGALGCASFGFWTPPDHVALFFAADFLFLTFYFLFALAGLSAPHRGDRDSLRQAWPGVVGTALALLWLLAYCVLIPGTFDAARYQTWLPSMYLFLILDVSLLLLFVRLFRDASGARWRSIYGLLTAAIAAWTALDLIESLSWAEVLPSFAASPFDLAWTLPLAIVLIAARTRHVFLQAEPREVELPRITGNEPIVSHVAPLATVMFPAIHLGFGMTGLLEPGLTAARELVVLGAIVSLGCIALFERSRAFRARRREQSRRETAETFLRESETRYRTLVEHAPEAIVILDPESGRFVDSNDRALELFRLSHEQLCALGPADLSPRLQPCGKRSLLLAREQIERALAGEVPNFDWVHHDSEGKPVHCEVYLVAMPSRGKTLIRGSMIDITNQLALRDQLRESRRMEAIGRLAGGVAHDFNNFLTVINGYSDLALESPELSDDLGQMIGEIKGAGEKAARLIGQLLAFGRRQDMTPRPLDLNRTVTDLEALLRRLLGEDLELDIRLDPSLTEIYADPAQVEQVIVNLAVNGRDAMPDGGFLHIETGPVQLDLPHGSGAAQAAAGPYGRISFRDTGIGMDEATKRRVFEPFFTTKGLGAGTGLGLATVYGIVAQSHGYVTVESAPGQGSTFSVHFPLAPADAASVETGLGGNDALVPVRGRERILFVEDEESVRSLQCTGLRALGYDVVAASDADQALELMAQSPGRTEVLVTDVVLPGLSGPDLAERIHSIDPTIKVIFVSGYTDDLIRRKGKIASEKPFLQKPFSPLDLARKIRGVLEAA